MRKLKEDSIKSRKRMDNMVRDMEKMINEKGADALIKESISLEEFRENGRKLLEGVKNV